MNARILVPLFSFILGAALAWGVQAYLNPPSERAALRESAYTLSQTVTSQKETLAKTEQRLAEAAQAKASLQSELAREKEKSAQAAQTSPSATPAPAKEGFSDMMRAAMDNHLNTRIDSLAIALHLTPEQVARLKQAVQNARNAEKPNENSMAKMGSGLGVMNKELEAMLTPEQKKEYEDFKTREKNTQVEMVANMETSQLQNMLNLSKEQSDQVFNKLADLQQNQNFATEGSTDPAQILQKMADGKKEALREILSPEQLKLYEQYLAKQTEMALKMMPSMKQSMQISP